MMLIMSVVLGLTWETGMENFTNSWLRCILWDLVSKCIYTVDVFCEGVVRCGVWFPSQDGDKSRHCLGEGQE